MKTIKYSSFRILPTIIFIYLLCCLSHELKLTLTKQHMPIKNKAILGGVSLGYESESKSISQVRFHFEISFNLSYCFFSRSTLYSGDGGVIYVSGGSYSMNVSNSMFYNCSCSLNGGAIYFSSSSNSCLRMICANRCSCGASSSGHLAYLIASQVNKIDYLSVSNCSHTTSGIWSIRLDNGNQRVDNTNSSMNNVIRVSGIGFFYTSSFTCSYCTFSNNKLSDGICIYFRTSSGIMTFSNIVHNNSPSGYGIVDVFEGSPKMHYCIFQDNQNTLFSVRSGSLEVSHSFISYSGMLSTSTQVSMANNNSLSKRETYQIPFFNSHYCNADSTIITQTNVNTFHQSSLKSNIFINSLIQFLL